MKVGSPVSYTFVPTAFISPGFEQDEGDFSEDSKFTLTQLRQVVPEISEWGTLALGIAWGDYSQAILGVSWLDDCEPDRRGGFLAYIYLCTEVPDLDFGITGRYADEVFALQKEKPWTTMAALPAWVYS
jgi:hypothetical protein